MLHIDFETRSRVDLTKTGVYRYAEDASTDIWCLCYAFDDGEPQLWVPGDLIPLDLQEHVETGGQLKAHNAQFERIIWREILGPRYGFPVPDMEQWHCSAAEAAAMALPRHLGQLSQVLGVAAQKDDAGHRLMMQMCKPRKPTKNDPREWWDDEERRQRLYAYCLQDVRAEQAVSKFLRPLSADERAVYLLDQRINDRGILVDVPLVVAAEALAERAVEAANEELESTTGVTAVTAVGQLAEFTGLPDMRRQTVERALAGDDLADDVRRALELRLEVARTSVKKLPAMREAACRDGRVRGTLLYHGASTGRWSGRIVQFQNVPRGEVKCDPLCSCVIFDTPRCDCGGVERLIPLVMDGMLDAVTRVAPPMVAISSLLRSIVLAGDSMELVAGDYAQIEARGLAWLAGQDDLVQAFADDALIYELMAAYIFGVPVDQVTPEQRFIGKTVVLGAGYQMGWKKFMAQLRMFGVPATEALARRAIEAYRERNNKIPELWDALNRAAYRAVAQPGTVHRVGRNDSVLYAMRGQFLWCRLPSGRFLAYSLPKIEQMTTPWGEDRPTVTVCGVNSMTKKWERRHLYGGLLAENVVQGLCRDLLAAAMLRLEGAGYPPVMSVHDEVVAEVPKGFGSVEEFESLMSEVPAWAEGLPVKVEAWTGSRYKK